MTAAANLATAPGSARDMAPNLVLDTAPNLEAPDDFYQALIDTHHGLDEAQSHALNARLVLLLANHIGAQSVLQQALAAARGTA